MELLPLWEALRDWAAGTVHRQRGSSAVLGASSLQCLWLLCTTLLLSAPGMALVPQADAGCAQHVFLLEGCDGLVVATALSCSGGFGSPEFAFPCQAAALHQAGELRLSLALHFCPMDGREMPGRHGRQALPFPGGFPK